MALCLKFIQKIATTLLPATTTSHLHCCSSLLTVLSVFILANPLLTFPSPLPIAAHNPTHKPSHIIPYSEILVGSHMIWKKKPNPYSDPHDRASTTSLASSPKTLRHAYLWQHTFSFLFSNTTSICPPFLECSEFPWSFLFHNVLLPGGM